MAYTHNARAARRHVIILNTMHPGLSDSNVRSAMFYLLFEYKDEKKGRDYRGFETKSMMLAFMLDNSKDIQNHKIIEAEKEYEFKLIEKIEGEGPKCKSCGKKISAGNFTGYCNKCSCRSRLERSKRVCKVEGCENKIADWNKSGLCQKCSHKRESSHYQSKRREKRFVDREIKKKEKEKRMGKCSKCKKEFELEDWQHSSLHWCPQCRLLPGYKDYKEQ